MGKRFMLALLAVALAASVCRANTPKNDIVILFTNDVNCGVDENIGYAGVEYYKRAMHKRTPYVTLVDAGNWAQGGAIGDISQGRYIVEIMNAMSYEIAVPGNHEFDYGWGHFQSFARNLKCGFVSANFRDLRTGKLVFAPYKMRKYGNVKVAFVGACTPESIAISTPSTFMDEDGKYIYDFDGESTGEKLIAAIQKAVDSAKSEGADYVVLVGHLGEYKDVVKEWSAPFIAERTRNIDVFIDGHSHEVTPGLLCKNLDGKDVVITQTGSKLMNIGQVTITKTGGIKTELISRVDGKTPEIDALVNEIKARYGDTLSQKLTHTDFILRAKDDNNEWLIRNQETGLADLVADALLASTAEAKTGKADVAIMNGGNIRNNIDVGDITFEDALNVLPYNTSIAIWEVSGQTILDELEHSVRLYPNRTGGFLHVAGMTYTLDARVPSPVQTDDKIYLLKISGERRIKDAMVNGEPLDPKKIYKLVGSNYIVREGGDGHVFKGAKLVEADYGVELDMFADYLRSFPEIPEKYKDSQHRVTFVK
ncbi:MAG: bifunctional metallophosphatase/5'-nucleotidase [Synergistaceae bacterium]|nr:bifunctional metallophosphatase/5'-nucleotidase [Synergistaceae bacterium]